MKKLKLILLLACFSQLLAAQSLDSLMRKINGLPDHAEKISAARQQLRDAFSENDFGLVSAWLGFLQTELDTDDHAATMSDERWLLYFWTENLELLFSEVADYEATYTRKIQYQNPPPPDDLFRIIDQTSFDRKHELYANIQRGFLNEEEKAFAVLLLDYLLRADATDAGEKEKNVKAAAFLKKYPSSRFKNYVWKHIYSEVNLSKNGFAADLLVFHSRHDGAMGINFKPLWSIGGSLGFWHRRMAYSLRGQIGEQSVRRQFKDGDFLVVPDSAANVFGFGFDAAYDLMENRRLHVAPSAGLGWDFLRVTDADGFTDLHFSTFYWTLALNIDWKFAQSNNPQYGKSWSALRFRAGYKHLNFAQQNPELGGSQIFVGVGASFFWRGASKPKF